MFGFPRAIAHGMWTKARCLAAFEGRLPAAYTVDVAFKTPVLLPAKVGFAARENGTGWHFDLFGAKNGKPHLTGTIS
jgi:acyl dehydratase